MCKSCKQNEILHCGKGRRSLGLATPSEPRRLLVAVTAVPTAVLRTRGDGESQTRRILACSREKFMTEIIIQYGFFFQY